MKIFNPYELITENNLQGDYIRQEDVISLITQAYRYGLNIPYEVISDLTNERDELQKQVIGLENEVNYLDSKIAELKIYKSNTI
jgi:hypothetical protein